MPAKGAQEGQQANFRRAAHMSVTGWCESFSLKCKYIQQSTSKVIKPRIAGQDLFQGNNLEYVNRPAFQPCSAYTAFKPCRHTLHCIQWEWRILLYSFCAILFDICSEQTLVNSSLNTGKHVCCGNFRKYKGCFSLGCLKGHHLGWCCYNTNTMVVIILL